MLAWIAACPIKQRWRSAPGRSPAVLVQEFQTAVTARTPTHTQQQLHVTTCSYGAVSCWFRRLGRSAVTASVHALKRHWGLLAWLQPAQLQPVPRFSSTQPGSNETAVRSTLKKKAFFTGPFPPASALLSTELTTALQSSRAIGQFGRMTHCPQ